MKKISNNNDYNNVMAKIDSLMAKGSQNVSKEELEDIRAMALAAQSYEQEKYVLDAPTTLTGMIEMRMFEMKIKQKDLADKLNISTTKLSLIMNGKQRPDIGFLKAIHQQLKVDADFILEHA